MQTTLISPYGNITSHGLRCISSYLKSHGYEVQMIFLPGLLDHKIARKKIIEQVVDLSRDSQLIGISLMSNLFDVAVQINQALKQELDTPVVWGGIHPTICPEESLCYADIVCIGEGEDIILKLIQTIESGGNLYDVKGIYFKDKGKMIKNSLASLINDLDLIPHPDYDLNDKFILDGDRILKLDHCLQKKHSSNDDGKYIYYETMSSRGCPHRCPYCCNDAIQQLFPDQKRVRRRSLERLIKELVWAKETMPYVNRIVFSDDSFLAVSTQKIKDFSKAYKEFVDLPFDVGGITPGAIDEQKMKNLVWAGLSCVRMGIQTGSKRSMKLYRRSYSNQCILEATKLINKFEWDNPPAYDFILDNPWETDDDLIDSLNLLFEIPKPYILNLFSLTFFPGTHFYKKAKEEGIITDNLNDVYRKNYLAFAPTYLNRIFILFREGKAPVRISRLLINRKIIALRLHLILYWMIKIMMKTRDYLPVFYNGIIALFTGNIARIIQWIKIKNKKRRELSKSHFR